MAGGGVLLNDVGAGDVGRHQIGRELDAFEEHAQNIRHGAHKESFGGAGETSDEAVAAHIQANTDLFNHFVLADDNAPDLLDDLGIDLTETRNP